jgi:vacuolar-type H+-ATPase subunit H
MKAKGLTGKIGEVDRHAVETIEKARKEAAARSMETEQKVRHILNETERILNEKRIELYETIEKELNEFSNKSLEALHKELEQYNKRIPDHALAKTIVGDIMEKLCENREKEKVE